MKKILCSLLCAMATATCFAAGSESPITFDNFTNAVTWTNFTWRQWVGSINVTFLTNTPDTAVSIFITDKNDVSHLVSRGSNVAMQTFYYVADSGPVVVNKGDKISIYTSSDNATATINMRTGD